MKKVCKKQQGSKQESTQEKYVGTRQKSMQEKK